jgi:hypothetical protein
MSTFESFKKGVEVTYTRDGTFEFKGIKLNLAEAIQLADILGDIITGRPYIITRTLPVELVEDKEILRVCIDKRLHTQEIPFVER